MSTALAKKWHLCKSDSSELKDLKGIEGKVGPSYGIVSSERLRMVSCISALMFKGETNLSTTSAMRLGVNMISLL